MPRDEGRALYELALAHGERAHRRHLARGRCVVREVGGLPGRRRRGDVAVLYSLDHHHGSEENQAGWEHFDPTLVDPADGRLNTLPTWQRTIALADLESTVFGLVGPSDGGRRALRPTARHPVHRRGPRPRRRLGRLRGLGPQGRASADSC